MKQHKGTFPATTPNFTNLVSRNNLREHLDGNLELPPTIPHRHFGTSVFNNELPRYRYGVDLFDRTFLQQTALRQREQLFRRFMVMVAASVIGALLFYVWFTTSYDTRSRVSTPSTAFPHPSSYISDQILLYRILGNDLPPRHKPGQTLGNVRFILEHEQKFPNTKKFWILNRIFDHEYEAALIALLDEYKQEYITIPFEPEEYKKRDFLLEDFPEPDFFHTEEYMQFSKVAKLRTIDYTYHAKNLYAMNNNGGRNVALSHGKSQPNVRWIMPFDGNCFLTANAFDEIYSNLKELGDQYKYFIVPMARLLNNTDLLDSPDTRPLTPEEPQIIFRHDSEETYDANMRYGRRSKLELLWRLGVVTPRKSLHKVAVPWESRETQYPRDRNKYKYVGWVFRLFSGQASQEENKKEATSLRAFNRLLAIQNFLDSIDEKIARSSQGFDPERLFLYDEKILSRTRFNYWSGDSEVIKVVNHLTERANEMMAAASAMFQEASITFRPNVTSNFVELKDQQNITDDSHVPTASSSQQNDVHGQQQGDPNVLLDLLELEDSGEFEQHSAKVEQPVKSAVNDTTTPYHKIPASTLFENITALTLAHYFSYNEPYARWAANLIRTYILSTYSVGDQNDIEITRYNTDFDALGDEGYGFPNLNKVPQISPKLSRSHYYHPSDLKDLNLSGFLDSCRLLYRLHALTHKEYTDLRSVVSEWLAYLVNSPEGVERSRLPDHRGTLYDLQVTSMATFVDDLRLYLRVVNRLRMRIGSHFHVQDGPNLSGITQPQEISFVKKEIDEGRLASSQLEQSVFHYTTLNLQYWMLLTHGIQNSGVGSDLWQYTTKNGQRLSRAMMGHLTTYASRLEDERLKPLLHIAQNTHRASDEKRGIWHEHGDEHDYFQHFLRNIGSKTSIFTTTEHLASEIDRRVGIGAKAQQEGTPPYWMLGIA